MIATIGRCERMNVVPATSTANADANSPATLFSGNAGTGKIVLADRSAEPGPTKDYAYRYIQNTGASVLNYAFNQEATAEEYHGQIQPSAQLAVPILGKVGVYSTGAWSAATLEIIRTQG